jgi:hypothetical protein
MFHKTVMLILTAVVASSIIEKDRLVKVEDIITWGDGKV